MHSFEGDVLSTTHDGEIGEKIAYGVAHKHGRTSTFAATLHAVNPFCVRSQIALATKLECLRWICYCSPFVIIMD